MRKQTPGNPAMVDLDDGDYLKTITRYMKMKQSPPTLEKTNGKVWNVMAKCLCYQQKKCLNIWNQPNKKTF